MNVLLFCAVGLVIGLTSMAPAQEKLPELGRGAADVFVPRLVIVDATHDFGEVKPGMPLQWTFTIKNVGNGDLLILGLKPG